MTQEGQGPTATFRYFLTREDGRPPRWLGLLQWAVLSAWLAFSQWLLLGAGRDRIVAAAYPVNGIFAGEVGIVSTALPIWGLLTLSSAVLVLWVQILWRRCGVGATLEAGRWRWRGRRGPERVEATAGTAGGTWCRDGRRWYYVAKGLVDPDGREWAAQAGGARASLADPRRLMSPLALLLLILLGGAYLLERPLHRDRRLRSAVAEAVWSGNAREAEALVRSHPPFRPWLRYLSSILACDRADCLRSQLADRLEMTSIGPEYGADSTSLFQLLVLAGRPAMAMRMVDPDGPPALDVAIRLDDPGGARAILAANGAVRLDRSVSMHGMLLLEEGRFDEAYDLISRTPLQNSHRSIGMRAALAYLTGRCGESEDLAGLLLDPESLDQARFVGEAPVTGLGALQRASQKIHFHASRALALAILGREDEARDEWLRALALASEAGIPGSLDVDGILLRRIVPGAPWLGPRPIEAGTDLAAAGPRSGSGGPAGRLPTR